MRVSSPTSAYNYCIQGAKLNTHFYLKNILYAKILH